MGYIAWGLLNLALFAGWVVIGWYALKLLKQRFGIAIAFVFALTTCSLINKPSSDNQQQRYRHLQFANNNSSISLLEEDGLWSISDSVSKRYTYSESKDVIAYSNAMFTVRLSVGFGKDTASGSLAPLYAYTTVDGLTAGVEWDAKPATINLNAEGNGFECAVQGTMQWKLLGGIPAYNQSKEFKGVIRL